MGSGLGLSPWVSHPPCGSGHDNPPRFPHLDNGGKLCPPTPESEEASNQETQGKALCALKIHVCNYKCTVFPRKCHFRPQNQHSAKWTLLRRAAPSNRPADHGRGGARYRTGTGRPSGVPPLRSLPTRRPPCSVASPTEGAALGPWGCTAGRWTVRGGGSVRSGGGPGAARSQPGRTSSPDSPGTMGAAPGLAWLALCVLDIAPGGCLGRCHLIGGVGCSVGSPAGHLRCVDTVL